MKRTLTALAAVAVLTSAVAPAAFAFTVELDQLTAAVTNELRDNGYDVTNVPNLTLAQLTTIKSLLDGSQGHSNEQINLMLEEAGQ